MSDIHKADGLASKLWNLEIGSITKTDSKRMVRFLDTNTINTIVALCDAAVKEARIDENDLGWHHQKHIEKTGISKWFVDRIASLRAEGDV